MARTVSEAARGHYSKLWKNLQHCLWQSSYSVVLLLNRYKALERISDLGRSAHLTKCLNMRSASLNRPLEASNTMERSDKHAYSGAPNNKTELQRAVTNYNLTLLLCSPSILVLFLILWKATLA